MNLILIGWLDQMYIRHQKRQANIDRHYKDESFIKSTS